MAPDSAAGDLEDFVSGRLNVCNVLQAGFGLAFCIAAIMCSVVGATTIATGGPCPLLLPVIAVLMTI